MRIGVPKEIKVKENRVACTPAGARALVNAGHEVLVQRGAGEGAGFPDAIYESVGARIVPAAADAWAAELVVKVKEPVESEYAFLRPGLALFTYLHLAADKELTLALMKSGATGIAYETVSTGRRLPLLEPMSEIAGRMSAIVGACHLSKAHGGNGVLLGGVPGVLPGKALVLGGGTAGVNAGRAASGLGADVTILEVDLDKMRFLDLTLDSVASTLFSNEQNLLELLPSVDLLIGAVLIPGAKAPKLVRKEMLKLMKPGSVFVDIAVDQGGCAETTRATTHENPVFIENGVVHYCVANMPGAYPRTATQALANATMPYILKIANLGVERALSTIPELTEGLNTFQGECVCLPVAEANGLKAAPNPFREAALA